jgi:hypothetical protein
LPYDNEIREKQNYLLYQQKKKKKNGTSLSSLENNFFFYYDFLGDRSHVKKTM